MKKTITTLLVLTFSLGFAQENHIKDSITKSSEIQGIILKSKRKKLFADHANYTFDRETLEKARHSKDLLATLPELRLDPVTNTITSTKGRKTLFLINGIEASDNQIKSVAPTNVVRVEYFDIPPARYAQTADAVVNIVTRNQEVGYSYGADVTSALTTGFVNASAYAGYTKGKNDFGLEYMMNLRDYDDRNVVKTYDYLLNGINHRSEEIQKDHFGYTYQNLGVRYANADSGKYAFQAKFNMVHNGFFSNGFGTNLFRMGTSETLHNTADENSSKYSNPSLDLYYSRNLGDRDELSLNVTGSLYDTKTDQADHEWNATTQADIFKNKMNLSAQQSGIVGEIAHTHQFGRGKLSSGYRISNTAIHNTVENLRGASAYEVNYLTQYLYSEYSGKQDKFSYRVGMGLTNIRNKSAEGTQDDWSPNPKVVLSYDVANNQSLRLSTDYAASSPGAYALSSNVIQMVPNIYMTGNPNLKPQHALRHSLVYSFNNKYVDFNLSPYYHIFYRSISQFYKFSEALGGYALTYDNADYTRQAGVELSGSVKPFGNNLLKLKVYVQPSAVLVKLKSGSEIKNSYVNNYFTLESEYKNFSVQYQFNFPVYMLNGAFLSTNENAGHFFAQYKYSSWSFTSGMYWTGMPSEYKTKSTPESLVNYTAHAKIHNNKNMFVLGASYNFSSGKKLQMEKKLHNSTDPASTF